MNTRHGGQKVKLLHLQELATQQKKIIICKPYKNKRSKKD